jgi:hypothetical protein
MPSALQTSSPHAIVVAAGQLPAPLHAAASVSVAPAQLDCRHGVSTPGYAHAVADAVLHAPAQTPEPLQAARDPWGGPAVTCAHIPRDIARSHARH